MNPRFSVGDIVALRADRARQGSVVAVLPPVGGAPRYRVFHSPTLSQVYREDQVELVRRADQGDDLASLLAAGDWLDAARFRARLTAARLAHPQIDSLYALHAARIRFIPFQFKPLVRFLHADAPRLLIADEVGVGKTIEAGLILKELEARQTVGNVLIVCPKALVAKWRAEMRRFDEEFHPLTGAQLRYCLHETHVDGEWPEQHARAIAHLELLRQEEYLDGSPAQPRRPAQPGLRALEPAPRFSLVIVDEAHHLRNPETHGYELARFLCDVSEAVVFLSATPVQTGAENLFALLHLLRPDLFPDTTVFRTVVEPNRHLTAAMRHVRSRLPAEGWMAAARTALDAATATDWGRAVLRDDPRFTEWAVRLAVPAPLDDAERVRCLRDLEEVHTLAHVVNRTRRRDIGRFTVREPHTVVNPFTPPQDAFYDELLEFRRRMLLQEHEPFVVRLILDTLERQAASCLPALAATIGTFLRTGRFATAEVSDTPFDDDADVEEWPVPPQLQEAARALAARARALPPDDPKLERLLEIVRATIGGDGPGKVLVFSFFLHTLAYLERALAAAGLRVAVVNGKLADELREELRERFRLPREHPDALDVLLSSEVGCEGLDYEFCDRLVNYDIPWNPMRVEQRIGRIDRFGQRSDKVLIYNFITPGTVEERIYFRCFERLGLFRDTIGDLEEVLGDLTQRLNRAALDPSLTAEQAEERACQAADNVLRAVEERRRLEEQSGDLLGLDPTLADELDAAAEQGRFVTPRDVRELVQVYLAQPDVAGRVQPDRGQPGLDRLVVSREGRDALREQARGPERRDRTARELHRWLDGPEPAWSVTFQQDVALERRETPFVTPVHALARLAVRQLQGDGDVFVARLSVRDTSVPAGRYLFVCDLWETVALQPDVRLVATAWDLEKNQPAPAVAERLLALVAEATTAPADGSRDDVTPELVETVDQAAEARRTRALADVAARNGQLIQRRLASLDAYYANRLQRLAAARAEAREGRIIRMREAEGRRVERDFAEQRRRIESRRESDIVSRRVAAGVLTVEGTGDRGE